ncbi:hypothetical protein D9M68_892830 [compost metagenome]
MNARQLFQAAGVVEFQFVQLAQRFGLLLTHADRLDFDVDGVAACGDLVAQGGGVLGSGLGLLLGFLDLVELVEFFLKADEVLLAGRIQNG